MSSLSLACGQCLLDQRRPRCIVVRQPECVLEILNQDCGIHLFQTWEKILAGLWLARSTQTEPAFAPLSDNIWEKGKKATWVCGMGTWSYYVKEKCLPIFLPRRAEMHSKYWLLHLAEKGLGASFCSCLPSTEFSQDMQWFFDLGPNCSEAQLWFLVAFGLHDFRVLKSISLRNCTHVLAWLRCTLRYCSCGVGMWIESKGDWLSLTNAERFQWATEESNDSTKSSQCWCRTTISRERNCTRASLLLKWRAPTGCSRICVNAADPVCAGCTPLEIGAGASLKGVGIHSCLVPTCRCNGDCRSLKVHSQYYILWNSSSVVILMCNSAFFSCSQQIIS